MNMVKCSPKGWKTLWEKDKRAIYPFPSVFKRLVQQTRKNQGLFGKVLRPFAVQDHFQRVVSEYRLYCTLKCSSHNYVSLTASRLNNIEVISKGGSRGGDQGSGPPPWNFGKKVVIRFVIGTGLILHSIYVNYSHKSKKGSKCGDLMVRT